MKRLQPVIWTKGTLLNPQHLQVQDRFLESNLEFQTGLLSFRPWGFSRLRIDQEALSNGMVAVSEAAGIFPDGLLFDLPASDTGPSSRVLADAFDPDQESIDAFLAVPNYREQGINVSANGRDVDARYRAEYVMVRDENTGLSEKPVQLARKNLRVLFEGEAQEGNSVLRLARIRRTPAGLFQLDPRHVPPLLDIAASDYLTAIARRLVEILSSRSSTLAGTRRQKNQSLADFTTSDIANFWLLYTINAHFPVFRHLFEARGGHPESLYSAMLALAGSLSTFSTTVHPRDLPPYDHNDLGGCFTILDEKLRLLLETVVPSNFVSLPLKLVQPSIYATALADDKYLLNTRMYLAISAEMSQADLIAKAPYLIKVCSASHIEHLVRQALPGVQMTHVAAPPSSIPVKLAYQYFSLNQSGPAWEAVGRARNLAAYIPAEFPNIQAELIILLPAAQ
ncbi:MAG TPA: type VI secretion system baseplate subunit TssK [Verrucomicrobiae bacterium]|nr:type VI secretion system baseplate subunit TssK [Verrucomicrobiae bacterium]